MYPSSVSVRDKDTEAAEPLYHEENEDYSQLPTRTNRWKLSKTFIGNILLFLSSCLILWRSSSTPIFGSQKNHLLRATSSPSPLMDLVDIPFVMKRINGTLLPGNPEPIYRQRPSAEVDAAWDRIATRNVIPFTGKDLLKMGKDPADAAKFPDDWFGPDKYIGKIDAFHQIHCLDRIRRSLYWNFEHYYSADFPPGVPVDKYHTYHVDHCIYVLLQNLQCSASIDVYPSVWMDAQHHPFPDFNINKKCRDFDTLLAWQEEKSIDIEEVVKIKPRPDSKIHIMSHEFKEIVRWYDDHPNDRVAGGEIA